GSSARSPTPSALADFRYSRADAYWRRRPPAPGSQELAIEPLGHSVTVQIREDFSMKTGEIKRDQEHDEQESITPSTNTKAAPPLIHRFGRRPFPPRRESIESL